MPCAPMRTSGRIRKTVPDKPEWRSFMTRKSVLIPVGILLFAAGMVFSTFLRDKPTLEQAAAPPPARPDWMASPQPAPAPQAKVETERALKIGVIGPETGEQAKFGRSVLGGVTMAVRRLNARGGIGGKAIEVVHYDNKGNLDRTVAAVDELVQQKVIAIIAAPTGWSTFAPTHMANESGTILISVGSRRRIGRSGPYVFRFALPDRSATDELVRFSIEELGYTSFALVTSSSYDHSLTLSALFTQAIRRRGGTIPVAADTYDTFSGKTDLGRVADALAKEPQPLQVIIFTGDAGEGARLAQAIRKAGVTAPIIGGEDLFSRAYLDQGREAVRGSLLYATFSPDNPSPRVAEFINAYAKEKGGIADRFTALAYDAATILTAAIRKTGNLRSSAVRDSLLSGKPFAGVTGVSSWAANGGAVKHPFIYRVEASGAGDKFVLVKTKKKAVP